MLPPAFPEGHPRCQEPVGLCSAPLKTILSQLELEERPGAIDWFLDHHVSGATLEKALPIRHRSCSEKSDEVSVGR